MAPPLELYILSFNCARILIDPTLFSPDFFNSLPASAAIPDVIAISLQELAPIAYSFLGGSYLTPYFDRVVESVHLASKRLGGGGSKYGEIWRGNVGLTGLLVFAREEVRDQITWIESAGVGVGLWGMGNKGAVGLRLGYAAGEGEEVVLSFVAAHLAPMEQNLERRNEDWENIVRGLVFSPEKGYRVSMAARDAGEVIEDDDEEEEPLLSKPGGDASRPDRALKGIYTPNTLVLVAGDLNYRTNITKPGPSDHVNFPEIDAPPTSDKHYSRALKLDQLIQELHAGRTMQHFSEEAIDFPPTYKYSHKKTPSGSPSYEWAKHRYPSWCDRILYTPVPEIHTHQYTSLPLLPSSDHQPVAFSLSLPLSPVEKNIPSPFPLDPEWKTRRMSARRKEVMVGALSWLLLTPTGRSVLVGLIGWSLFAWLAWSVLGR